MKRFLSITLVAGVAFAAGCSGDDTPAAGTDAGGRADTGPGVDSGGGGVDSGGGGVDSGGGGTDSGTVMCAMPRDCVWGEIDHEILAATDCVCLFGCPSLIQTRETQMRRQMQYDELCTPGVDGMGNPCPVDDCIPPPPLDCVDGMCVLEPDAGP